MGGSSPLIGVLMRSVFVCLLSVSVACGPGSSDSGARSTGETPEPHVCDWGGTGSFDELYPAYCTDTTAYNTYRVWRCETPSGDGYDVIAVDYGSYYGFEAWFDAETGSQVALRDWGESDGGWCVGDEPASCTKVEDHPCPI